MSESDSIQITPEIKGRFWGKVIRPVAAPDACWNWTAGTNSKGYGIFTIRYPKTELAHRFSFITENGEINEGYVVRQICKNQLCVNPKHLKQVKAGDVKGSQKFDAKKQKQIYAFYQKNDWKSTMKKFEVSSGTLGNIIAKFQKKE